MIMDIAERLQRRIELRRRRVLVIGDVMVDRWVHGRTSECQDNCVKFVQEEVVDTPGGAANAERSISTWGTDTSLFGYSRDDCPIKRRYVTDGVILFRADSNEVTTRGEEYRWARDLAREMLSCSHGVLLSDYDKGFLTPEFIREVVTYCRRIGIPCVADCKRPPDLYDGCILKCNTDYQHRYNDELSRLVFDAEPGQRLVVTAGPLNPIVWDGAGPVGLGYDLPRVKCVNHVGAGDCFAAHLTMALAYGFCLKESAALAHSAARVYVQHPHNRPPGPDEVARDMSLAPHYTLTEG